MWCFMIDMIKISKKSTKKEACNNKSLLPISKLSSWSWDSPTTQPEMVNSASLKKSGEAFSRAIMTQLAKCPKLTSKTSVEPFWISIIRKWSTKAETDPSSIPKLLVESTEGFCNSKLPKSSTSPRHTVICSKIARTRRPQTREHHTAKELRTNGKDTNTAFRHNSRKSPSEWRKLKEQRAHRNKELLKTDYWPNKNSTCRPLKTSAHKKMKTPLSVWASIPIFRQISQRQGKMWLRASIQASGIICTRIPTGSRSYISKTPLRMKLRWANSLESTLSVQI